MPVPITTLVSKKTLTEFREFFVGWVLREIRDAFDDAGLKPDYLYQPDVPGQRRGLVEEYYHALDLSNPGDVRKLLSVYEIPMAALEEEIAHGGGAYGQEGASRELLKLSNCLRRDGFVYENGKIRAAGGASALSELKQLAVTVDAPYILNEISRIEGAIDSDPWLAIGTAKELIESTCKTILAENGAPADPAWDLPELMKKGRNVLKLAPDDIPDAVKADDTVKRLLNNLASIVQSVAELRNPYGTGHGRHGRAKGLQPRHARLAAGAAATLVRFLFDTHAARSSNPAS
jgi:hypothetical protein